MKKILTILLLAFSITLQAQDQSKYCAFLDDAHKYANENDAEKFEYCLNGFFIAINKDEITPQSLTTGNRAKLFEALKAGFNNNLLHEGSDYLAKLVEFAKYYAEQEDAKAMNLMGELYFYGVIGDLDFGSSSDFKNAKYWFSMAADKGDSSAMNSLGYIYENVDQDYTTAKYWYQRAAEKGNDSAMNNLGLLFDRGHGVTKNYTTAMYWYEKAAEKGNASAMYNLGHLFDLGQGVTENDTTAMYWYEKACTAGSYEACDLIGKD